MYLAPYYIGAYNNCFGFILRLYIQELYIGFTFGGSFVNLVHLLKTDEAPDIPISTTSLQIIPNGSCSIGDGMALECALRFRRQREEIDKDEGVQPCAGSAYYGFRGLGFRVIELWGYTSGVNITK